MKVSVRKTSLSSAKASTLVLLTTSDKGVLWNGWKKYAPKSAADFLKSKASFEGKAKEVAFFRWAKGSAPKNLLVVSLGESRTLTHESYREAAAVACKALKAAKESSFALPVDDLIGPDLEKISQALTEGFVLASYEFTELKSQAKKAKPSISGTLLTAKDPKNLQKAATQGTILGEATKDRFLGRIPNPHP